MTALIKLTRVVDGEEQPIGREAAEAIRTELIARSSEIDLDAQPGLPRPLVYPVRQRDVADAAP